MDDQTKLKCSIGVMAYNEEKNIAKILTALLEQKLHRVSVEEIVVVSSGSTDRTTDIVVDMCDVNPKLQLITETERHGKASAINLFIERAKSELMIIISADTIPANDTVEKLITPFQNEKIGMTGGRPVPVNQTDTFMGFASYLLWKLHHRMAKHTPKLGEMVAFRRMFTQIPPDTAVDEASIEALITQAGLSCLYVSDALIWNKGPETLKDFIKQRKRIAIGHLWLKDKQNYSVASSQISLLINILLKECFTSPKDIPKILAVSLLEVYSRLLGSWEYSHHKTNPYIWETIPSTKDLGDDK